MKSRSQREEEDEGEWDATIRKASVKHRDPQVRGSSWSPQLPASHFSLSLSLHLCCGHAEHSFIYIEGVGLSGWTG